MNIKNKLLGNQPSGFLLVGSIVAISIAFSPYLFYLYEIFPSGPVWETSFFTYESLYFENVMTAAWTFTGKITPLFLLLIWFFTCKHWWYHVILIPTAMYAYQVVGTFYSDVYMVTDFMDANQLIYLAPFFIIILSIVYLIRVKVFDRIYGIDLSELNETKISVFSDISTKDRKEFESFQNDGDDIHSVPNSSETVAEDYYRKL